VSVPNMCLKKIDLAILKSYGSEEVPNFAFVQKRYDKGFYSAVVNDLISNFLVKENTDLNDDICVSLLLRKDTDSWNLLLSLVGKFAVLLRLPQQEESQKSIIVAPHSDRNLLIPGEKSILGILKKNNVSLLAKDTLEIRRRFVLHNVDSEDTCLYHILFTDTEGLPWQG